MEREDGNIYRWDGFWYLKLVKKKAHFVPTHQANGVVVNKEKDVWTSEESEKVKCSLKVKTIITNILVLDEFLCVSYCETVKKMYNILQVTHEGKNEVKGTRMNTLTHEYELFRIKLKKTFMICKNNSYTLEITQ